MIRVFLVAESPEARAGLAEQLKKRKVKVVGSAGNLEDAAAVRSETPVDAVLIDAARADFKDLVQELEEQEVASEFAVVVLADTPTASEVARALHVGVRAVLPTEISPTLLVSALEAASAGLVALQPEAANQLLPVTSPTAALADMIEALTPREHQVLQMLASGLANKEIAAQLAISEHTAKFHVAAILGKLGAESRTEAVAIGIRRGLVLL